jgi:hypothetical protein
MEYKILVPLAAAVLILTGCSAPSTDSQTADPESSAEETTEVVVAEPIDLTGQWTQTNSNSADTYQTATITPGTIAIDWVNNAESTKALYWTGSYVAPTEASDTYSWESQGDVAQMSTALMASGESVKAFAYEEGVLSYELSALGVTMTVEMSR